MKDLLIIQQIVAEDLGIFKGMIEDLHLSYDIIETYADQPIPLSIVQYRGLIVLGANYHATSYADIPLLEDELRMVQDALIDEIPVLTIDVGTHLLIRACGDEIIKAHKKEMGWYPLFVTEKGKKDPLFHGLPHEFPVFEWHSYTYNTPDGTKNLAKTLLMENQVVRIKEKVYGLQFHPQVTQATIERFLRSYMSELESAKEYVFLEKVQKDTEKYLATYSQQMLHLFRNWLTIGNLIHV